MNEGYKKQVEVQKSSTGASCARSLAGTEEKVKVQVTMDLMTGKHSILINQESAAAFFKWIRYAD